MKRKSNIVCKVVVLALIACAIGALLYGIISNFVPQKFDIYLNGELVDNTCAYVCDGHLYLPILGTMKLYGYEVNYYDDSVPEFIIDGVEYQLFAQNPPEIRCGDKRYMGSYTGGRIFLDVGDGDCYVYAGEIRLFLAEIGKENLSEKTDWKKKRVYLEMDFSSLTQSSTECEP